MVDEWIMKFCCANAKQWIFGETTIDQPVNSKWQHTKWRFGVSIYLHFVSKHLLSHIIIRHFHSLFSPLSVLFLFWQKNYVCQLQKNERGIWYDIESYENCINISSTITVARQCGGGFYTDIEGNIQTKNRKFGWNIHTLPAYYRVSNEYSTNFSNI